MSYFYILLSGFCGVQAGYAVYKTPVNGGILIDCSYSNLWVYQVFTISVNILFIFFELKNIRYYKFYRKNDSDTLTISDKVDYYKKFIGGMANHTPDEINTENYKDKVMELYSEIQCLNCFFVLQVLFG